MSTEWPAKRQKEEIEEMMNQPIIEDCFLVSRKWWESWAKFVEGDSKKTLERPSPSYIDNIGLLELLPDDIIALERSQLRKQLLESMQDWGKMKLRRDICEEQDYVVVSPAIWKRLFEFYGGGPCIKICVVGSEEIEPHFKVGYPDFAPVTLKLRNADFPGTERSLLISLGATTSHLFAHVSNSIDIPVSELRLKLVGSGLQIVSDSQTLHEYGISDGDHLILERCLPSQTLPLEEEKHSELDCSFSTASFGGSDSPQNISEDTQLRLALEVSLGREVPTESLSLLQRRNLPALHVDTTRSPNAQNPDEIKTSSTGESTPTRRRALLASRRAQEARVLQMQALQDKKREPNFSKLASYIAAEPVEETLEEYEEEFTEKLHLAQQKSCETRIQFIQKSSLTILQDLLSLEESLSSGVGILEAPTLSMECGKKECRFLE